MIGVADTRPVGDGEGFVEVLKRHGLAPRPATPLTLGICYLYVAQKPEAVTASHGP